jgi:uncharacterized protein YhbP (UPF0306 family)
MKNIAFKSIDCINYPEEKLVQSILNIFQNNTILAMSTIADKFVHINTAYFAFKSIKELIIVSDKDSMHSVNLKSNSSVAVAIWNNSGVFGLNHQGLQMFGTCEKASFDKVFEALSLYNNRFNAFASMVKHPDDFKKGLMKARIYIIKIKNIKLTDELNFGRKKIISLELE